MVPKLKDFEIPFTLTLAEFFFFAWKVPSFFGGFMKFFSIGHNHVDGYALHLLQYFKPKSKVVVLLRLKLVGRWGIKFNQDT